MACDLTSYREALAHAFRRLRPNVEVFEAEADELDRQVRRIHPDLVVCTRATDHIRDGGSLAWVELYPNSGSSSVISIGGERSTIDEIQLSDLLSVIDHAERSVQPH